MPHFRLLELIRRKIAPRAAVEGVRLNLGCGTMYMQGWVNVDTNPRVDPDIHCDFLSLKNHFSQQSVDEILMLHSISYLRLWEARIFLKDAFSMLKKGGVLVMEFPDIVKCAKVIESTQDKAQYLEGVRGLYAFDLGQIEKKESFVTYAFGWSGWHMKQELSNIGFADVKLADPETHEKRLWRDTRVVAIK